MFLSVVIDCQIPAKQINQKISKFDTKTVGLITMQHVFMYVSFFVIKCNIMLH